MVSDDLKANLVQKFHSAAYTSVIWVAPSQVDHVEDVCQQEHMNQDVRVVNARNRQDCISHASNQEDT